MLRSHERWTITVCIQYDILYLKNVWIFDTLDTVDVSLLLINPLTTLINIKDVKPELGQLPK